MSIIEWAEILFLPVVTLGTTVLNILVITQALWGQAFSHKTVYVVLILTIQALIVYYYRKYLRKNYVSKLLEKGYIHTARMVTLIDSEENTANAFSIFNKKNRYTVTKMSHNYKIWVSEGRCEYDISLELRPYWKIGSRSASFSPMVFGEDMCRPSKITAKLNGESARPNLGDIGDQDTGNTTNIELYKDMFELRFGQVCFDDVEEDKPYPLSFHYERGSVALPAFSDDKNIPFIIYPRALGKKLMKDLNAAISVTIVTGNPTDDYYVSALELKYPLATLNDTALDNRWNVEEDKTDPCIKTFTNKRIVLKRDNVYIIRVGKN